jgi:hypothetical protein
MVASLVPFIDPSGRNVMVMIAKCSYAITRNGLVATPDQAPVSFVDTHVGGDIAQDILVPSDLVDYKPMGEVIVVRPVTESGARAVSGRRISIRVGDDVSFSGEARSPWPFGAVPRGHKLRLRHAGTYDAAWQQHRMPLLPTDFDPLFHQAAPQAQRARGTFSGDEHVSIGGLYGEGGAVAFALPGKAILVSGNVRQEYFNQAATLDTMLIWSDTPRITLVWRFVIRPRQKIEEIGDVFANFVRLHTARQFFD